MSFVPQVVCPSCREVVLNIDLLWVGNKLCCYHCKEEYNKALNERLRKIPLKGKTMYDMKQILIKEGIIK